MALVGIWNGIQGAESEAILPYDQYLHRFAVYFQQGNMESNGKRVTRSGQAVDYATGPVILGRARHQRPTCFYQLLHKGYAPVACDFIGFARAQ